MPRFVIRVKPSREPEGGRPTCTWIDVHSINEYRGATGKSESLCLLLGVHNNRVDRSIELVIGNQLSETRDRERSIFSARSHQNGRHLLSLGLR